MSIHAPPAADAIHRPIEAHGIIGDLRSCALVADDGCIDFFCWPHFDSPTLFAALLDGGQERAGAFSLQPLLQGARRQQLYVPQTNVLQTRWLAENGIAEVTDLMPLGEDGEPPRLVRQIIAQYRDIRVRLRCRVSHDYARAATRVRRDDDGQLLFEAPGQPSLRLASSVPLALEGSCVVADFLLREGEQAQFVLGAADDPRVSVAHLEPCLEGTVRWWRQWASQISYRGRWREMVERSALALKLLTSRDHGSIAAAATFGLPEHLGGERNWDYRATWLRDASFTVYAFMRVGLTSEATEFMRWIQRRVDADRHTHEHLRIMYRMDGGSELEERPLPQLEGYAGSRPVRIGNAAHDQNQLDIYGELLDTVYLANKYGEAISQEGWRRVQATVDHVCANWRTADAGIWEMRGEPQHFLHSRLMCWVAMDRAIRLAQKRSLPMDYLRWSDTRSAIREDIWENFLDPTGSHFVATRKGHTLDGALLLMPLVRFVSATDPVWLTTLDAIAEQLGRNGLIRRYRVEQTPADTLAGEEGSFIACSFWYVECLARAGRLEQARREFEKLLALATPLGLYAEQFDACGRHLGNLPQALSHLALISAAVFLDRRLEGNEGHWQP